MVYVTRGGMALRLSDLKPIAFFDWDLNRKVEPVTDAERLNLLLQQADDLKSKIVEYAREITTRPAELAPITAVHMDVIVVNGEHIYPEFSGRIINIKDVDGSRILSLMPESKFQEWVRQKREAEK